MTPLNSHIQVEPVEHQDFIASMNTTYDEVGIVVAISSDIEEDVPIRVGDRVYFDSWMAAKFPAGEGKLNWYVPYANLKAYESLSSK